ncbi:MAG: hypothetical protein MI723_13260, partial [Caulobacterales bacterium]|nr:hypothetical protein [Caulobacterales bacterium]
IDLGFISIARAAADPAGHYARADATQLLLNREPRRPVRFVGGAEDARDAGETTPASEAIGQEASALAND